MEFENHQHDTGDVRVFLLAFNIEHTFMRMKGKIVESRRFEGGAQTLDACSIICWEGLLFLVIFLAIRKERCDNTLQKSDAWYLIRNPSHYPNLELDLWALDGCAARMCLNLIVAKRQPGRRG